VARVERVERRNGGAEEVEETEKEKETNELGVREREGGVVLVRFDLERVEEERITDNQGGYRRDVWCRKWSSRSRRWPRRS
jgi:hypothetical protein